MKTESRQIKIYVSPKEHRHITEMARQLKLEYPATIVKAVMQMYLESSGIQTIINEAIERREK